MAKSVIPAGQFKAQCLQLMDLVQEKHVSITITKHGKPVARLVAIEEDTPQSFFGCLKGTVVVKGDIVAPVDESWEADQ